LQAVSATSHKALMRAYADQVIADCEDAKWAPGCYDEEIPKLLDDISMEDGFEVTRLIQKQDPRYLYCHVLAHNVASRETAKDPDKWMDVVARCPTTFCNNGCPHGAIMERFNDQEVLTYEQIRAIEPDLAIACEPRDGWDPREVERSMCYHGLGHLNMFITGADLTRATGVCDQIGVKEDGRNYLTTCYSGAFMSVFQPLEPEDFALVEDIAPVSQEEVDPFCAQYTGERFHACHRESWPLYLKEVQTPEGLFEFCSYTDDVLGQRKCYGAVVNLIAALWLIDSDKANEFNEFCSALAHVETANCFGNGARRLIQIDPILTDDAFVLCQQAQQRGVGDDCYKTLVTFGRTAFHGGSDEFNDYCSKFPEAWQESCHDPDVSWWGF